MFIYNITTKVEKSIADDWMQWQREEHIPEIMATNLFNEFKIFLLHHDDDSSDTTYVIQYQTALRSNYETYIKTNSDFHQQKENEKWSDKIISFRTLLEAVQ